MIAAFAEEGKQTWVKSKILLYKVPKMKFVLILLLGNVT